MSGAGDSNKKTSYVPLFRGIEPYLWAYSPQSITVYLWLLIRGHFIGNSKGTVEFNLSEISEGTPDPSGRYLTGGVNLSAKTVRKALEELARGHLSSIPPGREAPPFIQILRRTPGRGLKIKVEILKAKLSAREFHEKMKEAENGEMENPDFGAEDLLEELARNLSRKMDATGART